MIADEKAEAIDAQQQQEREEYNEGVEKTCDYILELISKIFQP